VITDYSSRTIAHFEVIFEPEVRFQAKMLDAVTAILNRQKKMKWMSTGPAQQVLRDAENRSLVVFMPNRFVWQNLGSELWCSSTKEVAATIVASLKAWGVDELARVGFRTTTFVPLKMTHAEIAKLTADNYLAPADELATICGKLDDLQVHLYGTRRNSKLTLRLMPQTAAQAATTFTTSPNLEAFSESKFIDPVIAEFHRRINQDSLFVDADIFRENSSVGAVEAFVLSAVDDAASVTQAAVNRVIGVRSIGGD
jgi:hypothetical protein